MTMLGIAIVFGPPIVEGSYEIWGWTGVASVIVFFAGGTWLTW